MPTSHLSPPAPTSEHRCFPLDLYQGQALTPSPTPFLFSRVQTYATLFPPLHTQDMESQRLS